MRGQRLAEAGLLGVALPASLLLALVASPAWAMMPDPGVLLPRAAQAALGPYAKGLLFGAALAAYSLVAALTARRPISALGALVALVLGFSQQDAASTTWAALFGEGGAHEAQRVLLVGLAPVAILLAAFAMRAQRELGERVALKKAPAEATRAALQPSQRAGLVGSLAGMLLALALAVSLSWTRAPAPAIVARPLALLAGALLVVAAFGYGAAWFHRKPLAGERGDEADAALSDA